MDFARLDLLAARLGAMRPLSRTELARLRREFMIENTYNSNAIEGNTLTLRETALILEEGLTIAEKPIGEHLEAIGHRDAFEYVLRLSETDGVLTERTIREIHSLVLIADAEHKGVYRSVPVKISGALHAPPPPYLVPAQMERLLQDYEAFKKEKHIVEAAAEFHLRFEAIHPFIDGNGRTGRLILNLELIRAGLLPVDIKFTDRRRYYDCFDRYAETGTPEALAGLIAGYEEEELEKYIAILENRS